MKDTKTGAVICKKHNAEKEFVYEAVLFITGIPHETTDNQLQTYIDIHKLEIDFSQCPEILFRADIYATSNEVQEQYRHLHKGDKPVPVIRFSEVAVKLNI